MEPGDPCADVELETEKPEVDQWSRVEQTEGAEGLKANSRVGAEELALIGREGGRGRLGGISVRDQPRHRRLGAGQEQQGWETQNKCMNE